MNPFLRQGLIILIAGIFLISPTIGFGQDNREADSLEVLLDETDGEDRLDILYQLGNLGSLSINDRRDYFDDAVSYAAELGIPEQLVDANMKQGTFLYMSTDDYDNAVAAFERVVSISQENDLFEGLATAYIWLGRVYSYLEDTLRGTDYYNQAVEIAEENDIPKVLAQFYFLMARTRLRENKTEEAMAFYDQALPIAEYLEDVTILGEIYDDLGGFYYSQGNYPMAVENYLQAIGYYEQADMDLRAASLQLNLGNTYINIADYESALKYLQDALPVFEKYNSYDGITKLKNSLGVIYFRTQQFDMALDMYESNVELAQKNDDKLTLADAYNNIGNIYNARAEDTLESLFGNYFIDSVTTKTDQTYDEFFSEALLYYNRSLELYQEIGFLHKSMRALQNIGIIYVYSGKPAQALDPLQRSTEMNSEFGDQSVYVANYLMLGYVYLSFENYPTAIDYLNQSEKIALEINYKEFYVHIYDKLAEAYEKQDNYVEALKYKKLHFEAYSSQTEENQFKAIADMQVRYETQVLQAQNALFATQTKNARRLMYGAITAVGIFIILALQLFRQNNLKKKANRELAQKNALITEQKKEITDSIQYASRIQSAMLPPGDYVDSLMPERFIVYMPRDIVSGDYYYITEKGGKVICVAADCTGHGVPGAFMSMLGIAFLNEIMSKQEQPHTDQILWELRNHVITSLHQTGKEGESQDGMDVALFILDPETRKIEFSGANNPLFVYRDGKLIEAKADKMPIGIHTRAKEPFTRHTLDLQKGDMIYTFSDGYPDQFGGPRQKKFMIKNFKLMLERIHRKPMAEQEEILKNTLADWMSETEQVDDILVIGVRV